MESHEAPVINIEGQRVAGEPHDVIFMDCLAPEFKSPVMRRLLIDDLTQ